MRTKGLFSIVAFLGLAGSLAAAPLFRLMLGESGGGSTPTYLLEDGFEETDTGGALGSSTDGYDSTLVSSESPGASGTIDPDAASAIVGSQMLGLTTALSEEAYVEYDLGSAYSTTGIYLRFSGDKSANRKLLIAYDATMTQVLYADFRSGSRPRVVGGGSTLEPLDSAGDGAHIWIDWDSGSAITLAYSATGTKPTSGGSYATGTAASASIRYVRLIAENITGTKSFDAFKVDDAPIGSNP